MNKFASALSEHPDSADAIAEVIGQVEDALEGDRPDLVVVFLSPHHLASARAIVTTIQEALSPHALVGCSAIAVIGGAREVEHGSGISVFAAVLPETELVTLGLEAISTPDGLAITGWPTEPPESDLLILFADPFSFPVDRMIHVLNSEVPGLRVVGGMASAAGAPEGNRLILDQVISSGGAVGVFVSGGVEATTVASQGCRPVGSPYVVTKADDHEIQELAGKSAVDRLRETFESELPGDAYLMSRGLHIGQVVDEHREEFVPGDFLVRNISSIDEESGSITIADVVEVGRTVQFHVRDALTAAEDFEAVVGGAEADGALLFTCNGRGEEFFGRPDNDAAVLYEALDGSPIAGCFCAGELGPVGGQNFLHGMTASVVLFRG